MERIRAYVDSRAVRVTDLDAEKRRHGNATTRR
jgi:hypothetical protein